MMAARSGLTNLSPAQRMLARVHAFSHVAFDLDGTLYDTRDFEHPALAAVVTWLEERSGRKLDAMTAALQARRQADRHRPGLFDDALRENDLPAEWGAECLTRFHDHPGAELSGSPTLRDSLTVLRLRGCRLALVTNGPQSLQQRKLRLLGLKPLFDLCVYCDPAQPGRLKPSTWGWEQLQPWTGSARVAYVGDDPVDEQFARSGRAQFVQFAFRNSRYGN
jgi:FMN phosphatase YigB (HAD superfamily)